MDKIVTAINKIINKHGKVNTYHSVLILFILSMMGVFMKNQERILDHYLVKSEQKHLAGLEYRQQINPQIQNIISRLLIDIDADRVTLSELHNGEYNTANGLPFQKFTTLYEETSKGVTPVSQNYERVNTSSYRVLNRLFRGGILTYYVDDEFEEVDPRLYFDLISTGMKQIYLCPINGVKSPQAFIIVSYKNVDTVEKLFVINKIFIASQKISSLYNAYDK